MGQSDFLPFEEARTKVHLLKLVTVKNWRDHTKKSSFPKDIPTNPETSYKDKGWTSWGNWLGNGKVSLKDRVYLPFKEARHKVHLLHFSGQKDWLTYSKQNDFPNDLPKAPTSVYKDQGWLSWGDWLGNGKIASKDRVYLPFEEARHNVHLLKIPTQKLWINYTKQNGFPENIPKKPERTYKECGWVSLGDWLGNGKIANKDRQFIPFTEAISKVHLLNLSNYKEWKDFTKHSDFPENMPKNPSKTYMDDGWLSWGDWLGTGTISNRLKGYCSFKEAREKVHLLKIPGKKEWLNYTKEKESHHMHSHPNSIISGVLYIKCVENNDMIEFYDTVPNQFQIPPKEFTQYNSKRWWFNVAEKDLLLFPSTTTHAVQIKKENNLRISLAFNVFVKCNIGDNSDLTELIL